MRSGIKHPILPPFLSKTTLSRYTIFIIFKYFKIIWIYYLKSNKKLKGVSKIIIVTTGEKSIKKL